MQTRRQRISQTQKGEIIDIGDVVLIQNKGENQIGVVQWVGVLAHTRKIDTHVGVALADPIGEHDGCIGGDRYFQCKQGHGIFVPLVQVIRKIYPFELLDKISEMREGIALMREKLTEKDRELKKLRHMVGFVNGSDMVHRPTRSQTQIDQIAATAHRWDRSGAITPLTPRSAGSDRSDTKSSTFIDHTSEMELTDHFNPPLSLPADARPSETYEPSDKNELMKTNRKDGSPAPPFRTAAGYARPNVRLGRGAYYNFPSTAYPNPRQGQPTRHSVQTGQSSGHHSQYSDTYPSDMSVSATHSKRTTADDLPTPLSAMMTTPSYTPSNLYEYPAEYPSPSQMVPPNIPGSQVYAQPQSHHPTHHHHQSSYGQPQQPYPHHPHQESHSYNLPPTSENPPGLRQTTAIAQDENKVRVTRRSQKSTSSSSRSQKDTSPHEESVLSRRATHPHEYPQPHGIQVNTMPPKPRQVQHYASEPIQHQPHHHHRQQPSAISHPLPTHRQQQSAGSHDSAQTFPHIQDERFRRALEAHHERFGTTNSLAQFADLYPQHQQDLQRLPGQSLQAQPHQIHQPIQESSYPSQPSMLPQPIVNPSRPGPRHVKVGEKLKLRVKPAAYRNDQPRTVLHPPMAVPPHLAPRSGSVQEVAESPRRRQNEPQTFYHPQMMSIRQIGGTSPIPESPFRNQVTPVNQSRSTYVHAQTRAKTRTQTTSAAKSPSPNPPPPPMDRHDPRYPTTAFATVHQHQTSRPSHRHYQQQPQLNHSVPNSIPPDERDPNTRTQKQSRVVSKQEPRRALPPTPVKKGDPIPIQQQYTTPAMRYSGGTTVVVSQVSQQMQANPIQVEQQPQRRRPEIARTDPGQRIPIKHRQPKRRESEAQTQLTVSKSQPLIEQRQPSPGPVGNPGHPVTQNSPIPDDMGFEHGYHQSNVRFGKARESRTRKNTLLPSNVNVRNVDPSPSTDEGIRTPDYDVRYEQLSALSEVDVHVLPQRRFPSSAISPGADVPMKGKEKSRERRFTKVVELSPTSSDQQRVSELSGYSPSMHSPNIGFDHGMYLLPNISDAQHVRNDSSASTVKWYHSPHTSMSFTQQSDFPEIISAEDGGVTRVSRSDQYSDLDSIEEFALGTTPPNDRGRGFRYPRGKPLPSVNESTASFLQHFKSPAKHDRDRSETIFTETEDTVTTDFQTNDPYVMFQATGAGSDSESSHR